MPPKNKRKKIDPKDRNNSPDSQTASNTTQQDTAYTTIGTYSLTDSGIVKAISENNKKAINLKPKIVDRDLKQNNYYEPHSDTIMLSVTEEYSGEKATEEDPLLEGLEKVKNLSKTTGSVVNILDKLTPSKGLNRASRILNFANGSIEGGENLLKLEDLNTLRKATGGILKAADATKGIPEEYELAYKQFEVVNTTIDASEDIKGIATIAEELTYSADATEVFEWAQSLLQIVAGPGLGLALGGGLVALSHLYRFINEDSERREALAKKKERQERELSAFSDLVMLAENREKYILTGDPSLLSEEVQNRMKFTTPAERPAWTYARRDAVTIGAPLRKPVVTEKPRVKEKKYVPLEMNTQKNLYRSADIISKEWNYNPADATLNHNEIWVSTAPPIPVTPRSPYTKKIRPLNEFAVVQDDAQIYFSEKEMAYRYLAKIDATNNKQQITIGNTIIPKQSSLEPQSLVELALSENKSLKNSFLTGGPTGLKDQEDLLKKRIIDNIRLSDDQRKKALKDLEDIARKLRTELLKKTNYIFQPDDRNQKNLRPSQQIRKKNQHIDQKKNDESTSIINNYSSGKPGTSIAVTNGRPVEDNMQQMVETCLVNILNSLNAV